MPFVEVTITDAEMKALNSTPVTLIAAPGAGKRIVLFGIGACCSITTNGGTGVSGTIRYSVVNQTAVSAFTMITSGLNGPRETSADASTFNMQSNALTNRALEIVGSNNAGGTYASSDGFHVGLLYEVMDDPN